MKQLDMYNLLKNRQRLMDRTKELSELGYEGEELYRTIIGDLSDLSVEELQECTRSLIALIEYEAEIEDQRGKASHRASCPNPLPPNGLFRGRDG